MVNAYNAFNHDVLHAGLTPPRSLSDIHLKRTAFSSPHAATACMGRVHGSDRAPLPSCGACFSAWPRTVRQCAKAVTPYQAAISAASPRVVADEA